MIFLPINAFLVNEGSFNHFIFYSPCITWKSKPFRPISFLIDEFPDQNSFYKASDFLFADIFKDDRNQAFTGKKVY